MNAMSKPVSQPTTLPPWKTYSEIDTSLAVVPIKHWGRMSFMLIVVLLVAQVIYSLSTNPYISWTVVGEFIFNRNVLQGLLATIQISIISVILSTLIAVVVAVMRMSDSKVISSIAFGYVFFFRAIPLIVLLIIIGNIGLFVKSLWIGIPFTSYILVDIPINKVFTPFVASIVGLSLVASAYMSEIVRGGLLSIGRGQYQASMALGMSGAQTLRHILLPQALRVILPPLGNEFITTIKMSALVSVIAGGDLLTVVQSISGVNYRTIEMLFVATFWYLIIVVISSLLQGIIEKHFAEK